MSPIEYIAEGIRTGNWETVCEGYERLTGDALSLPNTILTNNKTSIALQQIYDIVAMTLEEPGYVPSTTIVDTKKEKKEKKEKKKKVGRPKKSKSKTKKSEETGDHTSDITLNIDTKNRTVVQRETGTTQLITNEPDPEEVKRNKARAKKAMKEKIAIDRPKTTTYDVKCNECESEFKSNRPGGEMGQKCRKCLNDKKSMFT